MIDKDTRLGKRRQDTLLRFSEEIWVDQFSSSTSSNALKAICTTTGLVHAVDRSRSL